MIDCERCSIQTLRKHCVNIAHPMFSNEISITLTPRYDIMMNITQVRSSVLLAFPSIVDLENNTMFSAVLPCMYF